MKNTVFLIVGSLLALLLIVYIFYQMQAGEQNNPGSNGQTNSAPVNEVSLQLWAEGFSSPVAFVSPKDGTGRMFLADQTGLIKVLNSDGKVLENNFLDLRNKMVSLKADRKSVV